MSDRGIISIYMKYLIEAGGRFTGPKKGPAVGAYLEDHNLYVGERTATEMLYSATHGALGSSALETVAEVEGGLQVLKAIEAAPPKRMFRVPETITPLVRTLLGERLGELLRSRNGALTPRIARDISRPGRGAFREELVAEYKWNEKYETNKFQYSPLHVSNRGFVQDETKQNGTLKSQGIYETDIMLTLTREQRVFMLSNNFLQLGQFVPLRSSDEHEPIVTGNPVLTVGIKEWDEFVPQVVMHTPREQDWEEVSW